MVADGGRRSLAAGGAPAVRVMSRCACRSGLARASRLPSARSKELRASQSPPSRGPVRHRGAAPRRGAAACCRALAELSGQEHPRAERSSVTRRLRSARSPRRRLPAGSEFMTKRARVAGQRFARQHDPITGNRHGKPAGARRHCRKGISGSARAGGFPARGRAQALLSDPRRPGAVRADAWRRDGGHERHGDGRRGRRTPGIGDSRPARHVHRTSDPRSVGAWTGA